MDGFVKVAGEVVHYHVQIFFVSLVSEKTVTDFQHIRVVQPLQDLQLPILVFLVLKHSLYCHHLQRLLVSGLVDYPECTATHLVLHLIPSGPR